METLLKCGECSKYFSDFIAFRAHNCDVVCLQETEAPSDTQVLAVSTEAWTKEKSQKLLSLYKERLSMFHNSAIKKKMLWEEITKIINGDTHSSFMPTQVEGRWKTLLSSYRRYKDHIKTTGAARKDFIFAKEMDEIMGDSHSTTPEFVFSSQGEPSAPTMCATTVNTSNDVDSDLDAEDNVDDEGTNNKAKRKKSDKGVGSKKKRTSGAAQMINYLERYTERLEKKDEREKQQAEEAKKRSDERHKEYMNVLKGLTDALKSVAGPSNKD